MIIAFAASCVLFGVAAQSANASHFRYGHYFWSPLGGSEIEFTLQNAWRRDANGCIDPATQTFVACSASDGLPAVGDVIVEGTGGTSFSTGDGGVVGSPLGALEYLVTAIDPSQNFLFGLALDPSSLPAVDTTIAHTYPASGDFLAFTDSCCRIGQLINNANGGYRVETLVNVGTGNRSPVSALPPIVQCPINGMCSFLVPGTDPDGDPLQFRLSTSGEASSVGGFTQPGPPSAPNAASIDPNTGLYTWDTTGATLATSGDTLYSTQVTIEDRDPLTGAVKSKVALDFIIKLAPVIGTPPQFDSPPTPSCGSTLTVSVGNALTFTVQASDADAGQTVTLNAVGLPVGATMNPPLPTGGNPVSSTFSWTPTGAQTGSHVVTFSATDDTGQQALCSLTMRVTIPIGADLSVTKADAPDPVALGGSLTYSLTVTNNGPDPSTDSTVADPLPAGVTFVSATPTQGSCSQSGGTVTCTLGPLAVGSSATIEIVVTVDPTAVGPLSDTATVTGAEPDPVAGNNSATSETAISAPVLDHFKCYETKQMRPKFDPREVVLTDQFNTERVNVARPEAFCNPVDKDGSGITNPTAHLACYGIRDVRGDEFPKFERRQVEVTDQFGAHTLLLKDTSGLCLPASKSPAGQDPGPVPIGLDHYKCYRTKQVGTKFDPRQVVLTDQFNTERVNVVGPEAFCNPVDKDGSGIIDPTAHLTCYGIRDVRGDEFPVFESRSINARDRFGVRGLLLKRTSRLCLPPPEPVEFPPGPGACVDTDDNGSRDNDGDALCDNWETVGLDGNNDGVADLRLYDLNGDGTIDSSEQADLNHKDVYLEIDFMEFHQPDAGALSDVIAAFAAAPVTNPGGGPGVALHIQTDELALAHSDDFAFTPCTASAPTGVPDFDAVKAGSFGTVAERGLGAAATSAKRFAFHYSLFLHNLLGLDGTSGCAEIFGNDFVVSLGSWTTVGGHPVGTRDQQAGTLMHEFGHNLNLRHGGADDVNCKPNYLSVMSYTRQIDGSPISGRPLDYSRSALATLDEANLNEPAGIGGPAGDQTTYGPPLPQVVPANGPIDWNRDSDAVDLGVTVDVNNMGISGCGGAGTLLQGHDDWSNLRYDFQNSGDFADGVHLSVIGEREITFAEAQELRGID